LSRKRKRGSTESSLAKMIQDLVDKLDEFLQRLIPQSGDFSDIIVVLVLLWMLMQMRTPIQPPPQYPVTLPQPKRQYTIEELMNIIKQCEKSNNAIQCVKDMLYGG